jgi:hypothetical protein
MADAGRAGNRPKRACRDKNTVQDPSLPNPERKGRHEGGRRKGKDENVVPTIASTRKMREICKPSLQDVTQRKKDQKGLEEKKKEPFHEQDKEASMKKNVPKAGKSKKSVKSHAGKKLRCLV